MQWSNSKKKIFLVADPGSASNFSHFQSSINLYITQPLLRRKKAPQFLNYLDINAVQSCADILKIKIRKNKNTSSKEKSYSRHKLFSMPYTRKSNVSLIYHGKTLVYQPWNPGACSCRILFYVFVVFCFVSVASVVVLTWQQQLVDVSLAFHMGNFWSSRCSTSEVTSYQCQKTAKMAQCLNPWHPDGIPGSQLWPGPTPAVAATSGMNQ